MIGARWKSKCTLCKEPPDTINMALSLIVVCYGYLETCPCDRQNILLAESSHYLSGFQLVIIKIEEPC